MTLEQAIKLVSPGDPFLGNMIKALSMCQWLNTPADKLRLEAAKLIQKNKRFIKYGGPKQGYIVVR
jgi:hypothetical protein